jgi:hypothetical protein
MPEGVIDRSVKYRVQMLGARIYSACSNKSLAYTFSGLQFVVYDLELRVQGNYTV